MQMIWSNMLVELSKLNTKWVIYLSWCTNGSHSFKHYSWILRSLSRIATHSHCCYIRINSQRSSLRRRIPFISSRSGIGKQRRRNQRWGMAIKCRGMRREWGKLGYAVQGKKKPNKRPRERWWKISTRWAKVNIEKRRSGQFGHDPQQQQHLAEAKRDPLRKSEGHPADGQAIKTDSPKSTSLITQEKAEDVEAVLKNIKR